MISREQKLDILSYITSNFGTQIHLEQWFEFEAKIRNTCFELHVSNWEKFAISIPTLHAKSKELETLACQLSVGETYFFREGNSLDFFSDTIIPELIKENEATKTISIWSAGCCTGEEPYTLAMLLKEKIPAINDWNINILATDINHNFLEKAKTGLYTPWSFRNTPDWAMKKYFKKIDSKYEICESIRNMVTFKQMNLVEMEAFPSSSISVWSIDAIFCRNVFIYFPTEQIRNIALRFKRCMKESGWLITSPVEVSNDGLSSFRYEWHPGVGILRKDSTHKKEQEVEVKQVRKSQFASVGKKGLSNVFLTYKQKGANNSNQRFQTVENKMTMAQTAFEAGQYCNASHHIREILALSPQHIGAQTLQARVFANLGDHHGAIVLLKELVKRKKNDPFIYYLLANMYMETSQIRYAEKSLRQALYINPEMISAQFLMGNIMQANGNRRASKKYFENLKDRLSLYEKNASLPELDGMTIGALSEIVNCLV